MYIYILNTCLYIYIYIHIHMLLHLCVHIYIVLVQWIASMAKACQIHPLLLSFKTATDYLANKDEMPEALREIPSSLILIRMSLVLMLNDLFLVLLPVTAPMAFSMNEDTLNIKKSKNDVIVDEIEWLFFEAKAYIFIHAKMEFAIENCNPPIHKRVNASSSPPLSSSSSSSSPPKMDPYDQDGSNAPVIEIDIEDEDELIACVVCSASVGSRQTLLSDPAWRLLTGLQASYACQFMKNLESSVDNDASMSIRLQQSLRSMNPGRLVWFTSISTPYPLPCTSISHTWLPIRVRLISLMNTTDISTKDIPMEELDWFHLTSFVQVSARQTENLMKLFNDTSWEHLNASEVNLGLVYMHAAGAVCGLGLNHSIHFPLTFQDNIFFQTVLCPPLSLDSLEISDILKAAESKYKKQAIMQVFALSFRRGIISIFPEVVLNLFTPEEFLKTFTQPIDDNYNDYIINSNKNNNNNNDDDDDDDGIGNDNNYEYEKQYAMMDPRIQTGSLGAEDEMKHTH